MPISGELLEARRLTSNTYQVYTGLPPTARDRSYRITRWEVSAPQSGLKVRRARTVTVPALAEGSHLQFSPSQALTYNPADGALWFRAEAQNGTKVIAAWSPKGKSWRTVRLPVSHGPTLLEYTPRGFVSRTGHLLLSRSPTGEQSTSATYELRGSNIRKISDQTLLCLNAQKTLGLFYDAKKDHVLLGPAPGTGK